VRVFSLSISSKVMMRYQFYSDSFARNQKHMRSTATFFMLVSAISFFGQPTIEYQDPASYVGMVFTQYYAEEGIDPGAAGAEVIWDFSVLPAATENSGTFFDAASSAYGEFYPLANFASCSGDNCSYIFSEESGFSDCGFHGIDWSIVMDDTKRIIQYPCNYGDTFTDAYHGLFTGTLFYDRTGTVTVEADAWGTLIMPWGTVNNVLRVRTQESHYDDEEEFGIYHSDSYAWYSPTTYSVILTSFTGWLNEDEPYAHITSYINGLDAGVNTMDTPDDFAVYPNPANSVIRFIGNHIPEEIVITDVCGRNIEMFRPLAQITQLDINAWSPGFYNVSFLSNGKMQTVKFLVE